jgi:integrase
MLYYTFAEKAEVADPESISGINKPQIEEMLKNGDMKGDLVSDWLQTYNSDRPNKKASFLRFSEWLDKTPNEILNLRRQDTNRTFEKLCIKYFHCLTEEKNLSSNTAVNQLGTIRSFFQYHDLQLNFKRNEIPSMTLKPHAFSLTIEHVRRMWQFMHVWQKAVTIVMLETGLRISDILALKKSDIENMLQMEFPEMEVSTKKEGVLAKIHLSDEAKETLKLYLSTIDPNQTKLFNKDFDTVNKSLKQLFSKAFPDLKANITPHDFRRLFISTATNCSINEWHIKYLCGKKIPNDMLPYLRNLDLKSDFEKIKSKLSIQTRPETDDRMKALENTMSQLEGENRNLKVRIDLLQQDNARNSEQISKLNDLILNPTPQQEDLASVASKQAETLQQRRNDLKPSKPR